LALRERDQILLTATASFLIAKTKYMSHGHHTTWQARSQGGGAMGAIAPPNSESSTNNFQVNQALMCKPKKCVSAN